MQSLALLRVLNKGAHELCKEEELHARRANARQGDLDLGENANLGYKCKGHHGLFVNRLWFLYQMVSVP